MARILCSFAVKVHDSQAYRKMDVTRERISRSTEGNVSVVSKLFSTLYLLSAVLSLGLEPSYDTTEPRYLKLVTVSRFCPFTLISLLMPWCLGLGLLGTGLHAVGCGDFVKCFQIVLPVPLPPLPSNRCQQPSGNWGVLCLEC